MKKVLSTLLAATLLLTTVTGLQSLSVSAEDGAAATPVKELVQNGDFENDGVVLADDFSTADSDVWATTIGRASDTLYARDNGDRCMQFYWGSGDTTTAAVRPVALKSNSTYRVSLKYRAVKADVDYVENANAHFLAAVGEDVFSDRTEGQTMWSKLSNALGLNTKIPDNIFGKLYQGSTGFKHSTSYTDVSYTFTTGELDSNKTYYAYIVSPFSVYVDDFKLEETFPSAVEGGTVVTDPADENNHCLELHVKRTAEDGTVTTPATQLTVPNFAVESNTFYKLSFKYKAIPDTEYAANAHEQLYCGINIHGKTDSTDVANKNAVEVFNQNGEWKGNYRSDWAGYRCLFSTWDSPLLSAAENWKTYTTVIKTGAVDPNKVYKFAAVNLGGDMLLDDLSVTKLVSDSTVQADFGFLGTAIRATSADENNQQLRFKAQVNKAALAAGHYNGFTVTEYGFLAFRQDFLAADINKDLRLNVYTQKDGVVTKDANGNYKTTATLKRAAYTAGVAGNASTDIVFSEDDTTKQFYARLTGFKTENYDKTYLVRTYAKLENADGVELTVYLSETTGLGVYDLANAALTAKNDDGSFAETLETRQTMWELLQNSSHKDEIGEKPQA